MSLNARGDARSRRQPPQMLLGWVALAFFVAAVVMALLKYDPFGFAFVAVGGLVSVVALVLEFRQRQAVNRSDQQVFPEQGTFGARRSTQTHTKF